MATSCASSSAPDKSTRVHDCSDGGLALTLAEMAMAGGIGATIATEPDDLPRHAFLFGEDQARYVLAVPQEVAADILYEATAIGVPAALLGVTGGASLILPGGQAISVASLKAAHEIVASRLHGRQGLRTISMPMDAIDIETMIKAAIPDAIVEIRDLAGDGDHFAATVTSAAFRGKSRVQQHQMVYAALQGRMGGVLHALALTTVTPDN